MSFVNFQQVKEILRMNFYVNTNYKRKLQNINGWNQGIISLDDN